MFQYTAILPRQSGLMGKYSGLIPSQLTKNGIPVFLGLDGVYSWIGAYAQVQRSVYRFSKMGAECVNDG